MKYVDIMNRGSYPYKYNFFLKWHLFLYLWLKSLYHRGDPNSLDLLAVKQKDHCSEDEWFLYFWVWEAHFLREIFLYLYWNYFQIFFWCPLYSLKSNCYYLLIFQKWCVKGENHNDIYNSKQALLLKQANKSIFLVWQYCFVSYMYVKFWQNIFLTDIKETNACS